MFSPYNEFTIRNQSNGHRCFYHRRSESNVFVNCQEKIYGGTVVLGIYYNKRIKIFSVPLLRAAEANEIVGVLDEPIHHSWAGVCKCRSFAFDTWHFANCSLVTHEIVVVAA